MSDSSAERITRGSAWTLATRWLSNLIGFISTIVLARILLPNDFGLVAIAAAYVAIIEGVSDFNVSHALIQSRSDERDLYDTAWTLAVLRGVISSAVMVTTAGLAAGFMGDARLETLIYVLALAPFLRGFVNPRFIDFEKKLIFSKQAYIVFSQRIVAFVAIVAIALIYQTYWALIVGTLIAALVQLILSYTFIPYRPNIQFSRTWEILSFSGWMSLARILATLTTRMDNFVVGRILGISQAGLYFMAREVGHLPTEKLTAPLNRVLFPAFSEISENKNRLRKAAIEALAVMASIGLSASVGFAFVADNIVPLVLGPNWVAIISLLQALVPIFGLMAIFSISQPVAMSVGATLHIFWNAVIYSLIRIPLFIAGVYFWGMAGLVWALLITTLFYCALQHQLLRKTVEIRMGEIISSIARPVCATICMAIALMLVHRLQADVSYSSATFYHISSIALELSIGATVFCGVHWLIWINSGNPPGIEVRLLQMLNRYRSRNGDTLS